MRQLAFRRDRSRSGGQVVFPTRDSRGALRVLTGNRNASCGKFTGKVLHFALSLQMVFSGFGEQKAFCAWELRVLAKDGLKDC